MIQALDTTILLWVQEHMRSPVLNALMILITTLGNGGLIWIVISVLMMLRKKYRPVAIIALLAMACCYIINDGIIKNLIQRPRPFLEIPELVPLIARPDTFSMPSGHACSSFAAAIVFLRRMGGKGAPFLLLAAAIAFSRVYVGVHYPSDVLIGIVIGIAGGCIFYSVFNNIFRKRGLITKTERE